MARDVTLRLDDALLQRATDIAVERDQSLSEWIADLVTDAVSKQHQFNAAKERALKHLDKGYHLGGKPVTRETIYER